jgi:hypothetical protein
MSKFNVGDAVRLVQVTDIDAELDDPNRILKTNEDLATFGFIEGVQIGSTGVVVDAALNDYYDMTVEFDGENYAMVEADMELVEGATYTVTGTVPTPHYNRGNPVHLIVDDGPQPNSGPNGTAGRKVSVTTKSKNVANALKSVYEAVFEKVTVTAK